MENLIFLLATTFVLRMSGSRKFKHYFIGNTGCSTLWFASDRPFERTITRTGDTMYFTEHTEKNVTYGVICIEMQEDYTLDESRELLLNYMDLLRAPFSVLHQTGAQKQSDWNTLHSLCFEDYWQDHLGLDWKVKGYTNGRFLAVLYVKNIGAEEVRRQDAFLDSFHAPVKVVGS